MLQVWRLLGVQFTENRRVGKNGQTIVCVHLLFGQLDYCGWHVSILLPYGTEVLTLVTYVGRYSAPIIVDSQVCSLLRPPSEVNIGNYLVC